MQDAPAYAHLPSVKELAQGHGDAAVPGPQEAIERREMPFASDGPSAPRWRIEHPDVRHAHREGVVKFTLQPGKCIVWRKNLDADAGRVCKYLFVRFRQRRDTNIGNAVPPLRYPHPQFRILNSAKAMI